MGNDLLELDGNGIYVFGKPALKSVARDILNNLDTHVENANITGLEASSFYLESSSYFVAVQNNVSRSLNSLLSLGVVEKIGSSYSFNDERIDNLEEALGNLYSSIYGKETDQDATGDMLYAYASTFLTLSRALGVAKSDGTTGKERDARVSILSGLSEDNGKAMSTAEMVKNLEIHPNTILAIVDPMRDMGLLSRSKKEGVYQYSLSPNFDKIKEAYENAKRVIG